jgi:phosphoserine phosphatase
MASRLLSPASRRIWQQAQAVCFDVDSTVIPHEAIDLLANWCGKSVAELTQQAMSGSMSFEQALALRLQHIDASFCQFNQCLLEYFHPTCNLTPGIDTLIELLHRRGVKVFLVSGGFEPMVHRVADQLRIPRSHVFANRIVFGGALQDHDAAIQRMIDNHGASSDDDNADWPYTGFDATAFTSRSHGKAAAVAHIKHTFACDTCVMIGDGMTDAEARPPASMFIGFGGVVARDNVRLKSDEFIMSFDPLIAEEEALQQQQQQ